MTTTPMNFRAPSDLKNKFEATCRSLNMPMTAQLVLMMREFVRSEAAHRKQYATDSEPLSFYSSYQEERHHYDN